MLANCGAAATLLQHLRITMSSMGRWLAWTRSFYFRIAVTFVAFMVGVLAAQSLVFTYLTSRSSPTFLSPNVLAVTVAADVQEALTADPSLDIARHLQQKYGSVQALFVVMDYGRIGSNTTTA